MHIRIRKLIYNKSKGYPTILLKQIFKCVPKIRALTISGIQLTYITLEFHLYLIILAARTEPPK